MARRVSSTDAANGARCRRARAVAATWSGAALCAALVLAFGATAKAALMETSFALGASSSLLLGWFRARRHRDR